MFAFSRRAARKTVGIAEGEEGAALVAKNLKTGAI